MLKILLASLALIGWTLAVTAEPNLAQDLAYGPQAEQRLDIHAPASSGLAPAILMVHGGAWQFGDKAMGRVVDNKVARWLPLGMAFVTINYRMLPTPPLEQARDVARALAWVQQNGEKFGVDRSNIVLMGHSAGAHLIALLAARPELFTEAGAQPALGFVLLDSAALDIPAIMNARHVRIYDRAFGGNPTNWLAASPYQQLRQASAPILAVCSLRRDDACPQARNFVARAQQLGTAAEVLALDKTHGAINARLGEDPEYTAAVERFLRALSPLLAERLR